MAERFAAHRLKSSAVECNKLSTVERSRERDTRRLKTNFIFLTLFYLLLTGLIFTFL